MRYEKARVEVVMFDNSDVVTSSHCNDGLSERYKEDCTNWMGSAYPCHDVQGGHS